ncbi:MAG: hypothetical protein DRG33_03555 [Deltaproteobacteria bacterium]|nr:MAG: hypothetical protein DRG33_03555 [Deltaproteobacteria bacterium]
MFPIFTNFKEIIKVGGKKLKDREITACVNSALNSVHLSPQAVNVESYPHQLSGGMQQRILIALALLVNPELIVADEPTSNLDVTTEYAIINLFKEIRHKDNVSFLLTTHNLGLARNFCDRIYVFFMGNVVETATTEELFTNPKHPYTRALLDALPSVKGKREIKFSFGSGGSYEVPDSGCPFQSRCRQKIPECSMGKMYKKISDTHIVQCRMV